MPPRLPAAMRPRRRRTPPHRPRLPEKPRRRDHEAQDHEAQDTMKLGTTDSGTARRDGRPLALVTGASRGIGAALARELARHGHDLVLSARSIGALREFADELRRTGAETTVIGADLSMQGAAAQLADELEGRGLSIDVLINNAGLGGLG